MTRLLKNILAFSIIISLILGTSGVEVFKHVCFSHNVNMISLIEVPKCDMEKTTEVVENCCGELETIVVESYCCESEKAESVQIGYSASEECCTSFSDLKKIEELLYPPVENKILLGLIEFSLIDDFEIFHKSFTQKRLVQNNDPVPISFGRDLLYFIHQLKIDTPVC